MAGKEVSWLYNEIPGLVENGIISEEAGRSLKNHYAARNVGKAHINTGFLITGIIGSALVGAGIIAIIAHNWNDIGKPGRAAISILLLLLAQSIYGYAFLTKRASDAWMESTSGFLGLIILSSLLLISQTYNLGGNLHDLMLAWGLLMTPLLYLRRVVIPFIFLLIAATALSTIDHSVHLQHTSLIEYTVLMLLAMPYFYFVLAKSQSVTVRTICGWSFCANVYISLPYLLCNSLDEVMVLCAGICSFLYVAGRYFYDNQPYFWFRPFQTIAIAGAFIVLSFCAGYRFSDWDFHKVHLGVLISLGSFTIATILFIIFLVRKNSYLNLFPASLVIIVSVFELLGKASLFGLLEILANVFLFSYAVYYIWKGMFAKKMYLVNLGMFFIASQAVVRFFNSDISFLIKGLVFIAAGFGFLLANLFINRQLKRNEA